MELEFHQLDLRYARLRRACTKRDGRVLASLDRHGQQLPVVVVASGDTDRYVLVDGFRRVRALVKLGKDTVRATCWDLSEADALLLGRLMRNAVGESAIEQGWLLAELRERFGLTVDELARRFGRSSSWVSRRMGLVSALPDEIQREVRAGRLGAHAAMSFLLPLSRANRGGSIALTTAIAPLQPSTRQTKALCLAYARSKGEARRYLLSHPERFLRAREAADKALPVGAGEQLMSDIDVIAAVARRATARVREGAVGELLPPERDDLRRRLSSARSNAADLFETLTQELDNVGRKDQDDHSFAVSGGAGEAGDRAHAQGVAGRGAGGTKKPVTQGAANLPSREGAGTP